MEVNSEGTVHLNSVNKKEAQQFCILKYYQITFKDGDSSVETQWVESGESATAPVLSKNGYELSWDKNYGSVTSDMIINAVWTKQEDVATETPVIERPTDVPALDLQKTEKPTETKTPAASGGSTGTKTPAISEEPMGTKMPATSEGSTETKTPVVSEEPTGTKMPATSKEPTVTKAPMITSKPVPTISARNTYSDEDDTVSLKKQKKVILDKKILRVKRGKKVRIRVAKKSADDYVKGYRIVGKKKNVVVSSKGVVKGRHRGRTTVKVLMYSGASAKCRVIVK